MGKFTLCIITRKYLCGQPRHNNVALDYQNHETPDLKLSSEKIYLEAGLALM